jgi:pre-rRNA-processing protein SRD1
LAKTPLIESIEFALRLEMANNYNNGNDYDDGVYYGDYGTTPFPIASSTSSSQANTSHPALDSSNAGMMTFAPSDPLRMGNLTFSESHESDMLLGSMSADELLPSTSSSLPAATAPLADHRSNALFAYDPLFGIGSSGPMALDTASAFAYDPSSVYPQPSSMFEQAFNRQEMQQYPSFQNQALSLDPTASYSNSQTLASSRNSYWTSSVDAQETTTTAQAASMANRASANVSRSTDSSQSQQLPHRRRQDLQAPTRQVPSHRYIQPKRPSPMKSASSSSCVTCSA